MVDFSFEKNDPSTILIAPSCQVAAVYPVGLAKYSSHIDFTHVFG